MGTAPAPGSWAHLQVLARGHSPCSCLLLTSPAPGPWAYPLLLAHGTFRGHIPTLRTCPRARAKPSHRSSSPKRSQVSSQQRLTGSSPSCLGCHQGAAPPVSPRGAPGESQAPTGTWGQSRGRGQREQPEQQRTPHTNSTYKARLPAGQVRRPGGCGHLERGIGRGENGRENGETGFSAGEKQRDCSSWSWWGPHHGGSPSALLSTHRSTTNTSCLPPPPCRT